MSRKRLRWIVAVWFVLTLPGGITAQAGERAVRQAPKPRTAPQKKRVRLPHIKMTERDWRRLNDTRRRVRKHAITAAEITALAGVAYLCVRYGTTTFEQPELPLGPQPQ